MARTVAILTMALTGFATTYAGSLGINPGDYLNPDGSVSIGLMPNLGTMLTGTANSADGLTGSFWGQRNYYGTGLLAGATVTNLLPQTSSACAANCQGGLTTAPPYTANSATIYQPSGAPEFNLLGDNAFADAATTADAWISTSSASATGTLTIPVGIFGVTSIDTMLNQVGTGTSTGTVCVGTNNGLNAGVGCSGTNSYAYLTLTFTTTGGASAGTEIFALMNGVTQRNVMDAAGDNTLNGYNVVDTSGTYAVTEGQLYTSPTSAGGTMVLDYQAFPVFTEYQGDVLSSISISSVKGTTASQELLSAITVDTAPEPSTIVMLFGGLGVIGLARLRRSRVN
jgi:PEP-CTERM motif